MSPLVSLLILILILGIVAWLAVYLIDLLPAPAQFKQAAKAIVLVVAIIILLVRALPLAGVSVC